MNYIEIDTGTQEILRGVFTGDVLPEYTVESGITAVEVTTFPDTHFITGQVYNAATSAVEDTAVSLSAKARTYLLSTDWYIIRNVETGVATPAAVTTERAASRLAVIN